VPGARLEASTPTLTAERVVPLSTPNVNQGVSARGRIVQLSVFWPGEATINCCVSVAPAGTVKRISSGERLTAVATFGGSTVRSTGTRTSGVPGAEITRVAV